MKPLMRVLYCTLPMLLGTDSQLQGGRGGSLKPSVTDANGDCRACLDEGLPSGLNSPV